MRIQWWEYLLLQKDLSFTHMSPVPGDKRTCLDMVWVANANLNTYRHICNKDLRQKCLWNICSTYHHVTGPNNTKTFIEKNKSHFSNACTCIWLVNINTATWPEGKISQLLLWLCTFQENCCLCQPTEQHQPHAPTAPAAPWTSNVASPAWRQQALSDHLTKRARSTLCRVKKRERKNLLPRNKPASEWCGPLLLTLSVVLNLSPGLPWSA